VAVAGFIGTPPMNLLPGQWNGSELRIGALPRPALRASAPRVPAGSTPQQPAREVTVGIRPGDLRLAADGLAARVELIEDLGDSHIVDLVVDDRPLKLKMAQRPEVREGEIVHIGFDQHQVHLFDVVTGARL
jgi:ABC-type sugar transport system ATPase subunit